MRTVIIRADAPDILSILAEDGTELLRITPESEWVWAEGANPDEAAKIFAEAVVKWLPLAALERLAELAP